jgi:hypothetical protein
MSGRPVLAVALVLFLAGCGGGAQESSCVEGWQEGTRDVSVREAVEDPPSGVVSVQGALVFRDLETRLCASLLAGGRCGEPSLAVARMGNPFRAVEGMTIEQADPPIGWTESMSIDGFVEDGELSVPLNCGSERVIEGFAEETGQRLHRDLFGSGSDADFLNFEAAPDPDVAAAREREWGRFSVLVMVESRQPALEWSLEQLGPYVAELPSREPDSRGVVWVLLEEHDWLALKPYGNRHLLQWSAGGRRELDARWRRLDEVLTDLA